VPVNAADAVTLDSGFVNIRTLQSFLETGKDSQVKRQTQQRIPGFAPNRETPH